MKFLFSSRSTTGANNSMLLPAQVTKQYFWGFKENKKQTKVLFFSGMLVFHFYTGGDSCCTEASPCGFGEVKTKIVHFYIFLYFYLRFFRRKNFSLHQYFFRVTATTTISALVLKRFYNQLVLTFPYDIRWSFRTKLK